MNRSVQLRLSVTLVLAILAVAVVTGMFSFAAAIDEANELQDDMLRQVARVVRAAPAPNDAAAAQPVGDSEAQVVVQAVPPAAASAAAPRHAGRLALPPDLADGMHTLNIGGAGYRVLVRTLDGGQRVAVAQASAARDDVARDSALRTLLPFLVLVPVLAALAGDLVRKMFRPIAVLAAGIDARNEDDLRPLDLDRVPDEVRPFVAAINRMFDRVGQALDNQRRFVADAAHELRSPLTAISLQAERLAGTPLPAEAAARVSTLRRGIERGRALLDQLLDLARAQAAVEDTGAPVALRAVFARVLEDLLPLAEAKFIDVGVLEGDDASVPAGEADLIVLVKNLVDNAIRYSPPGSRVDLALDTHGDRIVLTVRDNGPGIAPGERDLVFAPFHRGAGNGEAGSGLGLSIVGAIATRIGAQLRVHAALEDGTGLRVTILFPCQQSRVSVPIST